jgi:hypothetical protein
MDISKPSCRMCANSDVLTEAGTTGASRHWTASGPAPDLLRLPPSTAAQTTASVVRAAAWASAISRMGRVLDAERYSIRCPRPDAADFHHLRSRKVRLRHSRGSHDQLACNTVGDSGWYARMGHRVAKAVQRDSTACLVGFCHGAPHDIRFDSPATHALRARVRYLEPRALPGRHHPSRALE